MDDLISRRAAIDAAKAYWYKPDIAGAIEQLPSAQPEIIRCKDCKHWKKYVNGYGCDRLDVSDPEWWCKDGERKDERRRNIDK